MNATALCPADLPTAERRLPLTPGQRQLLAGPAEMRSLTLSLRGPLDLPRLNQALFTLAHRHDVLRARLTGPSAAQAEVTFSTEGSTWLAKPRPVAPGDVASVLAQEIARPLDLVQQWSRFSLLKLGLNDHLLLFVGHPIGFDDVSLTLLAGELAAAYRVPALPDPSSEVLADWLHSRASDRADRRWAATVEAAARALRDEPPVLELPGPGSRPSLLASFRSTSGRALDRPTLTALAERLEVTVDDVVLAAYAAWIQRRTNSEEVVIGVELRPPLGLGPYARVAVLRLALPLTTPMSDLIRQVAAQRRICLAGPAVELGAPLAPLMFQSRPALPGPKQIDQLVITPQRPVPASGQAELTLQLAPDATGEGMSIEFIYASDLFDHEASAGMMAGMEVALAALAENVEVACGRLPVMSAEERARTLGAVDRRPCDFDRSTIDRFAAQVALTPDRPAVLFAGQPMTFAELDRRSNQVAHRLIACGVGPDALVGIYCERSPHMLVAALAVMKAGGAYVPLDPGHPPARTQAVLEDAAPAVLLTTSATAVPLPAGALTQVVTLDDPALASLPTSSPGRSVRGGDLAYVIFTSGSTGRPKGVGIPHRAFTNFLESMARRPGFGPQDRVLAVTTPSFDIAGLELFLPLVVGGSLEIADAATCSDADRLAARLADPEITVVQGTPASFRLLLERGWSGRAGLRVLCGGEALQPDLIAALLARVGELWNMYGPTETTVWSSVRRLTTASTPVSIGYPIANTALYVLSPLGEPVPFGAVGEITIGGEGVARGYHQREALTAERFVADPFADRPGARMYRTGDLGRFLPDGSLSCLGRLDFQVKIRGFRIETGEIEKALLACPGVTQAVVTAWEPRPGDKRLVAHLVAPLADPLTLPARLRAELEERLPPYMVPSHFVPLPSLPRGATGKIDRKALPPPSSSTLASVAATAEPPSFADDLEASIHEAFASVLEIPQADLERSFFDLGGDSILAARLTSRLERTLGTTVPLALLFEAPSVRGLAGRLRGAPGDRAPTGPRVVMLRKGTGTRKVFCVCGIALYNHLARALPADVSVLGVLVPEEAGIFDAQTLQEGRAELPSVERLASLYVQAIRQEQPQGPYRVAGISFGGVLAYEVARQLEAAGSRVALLALLDPLLPQALRAPPWRRLWWALRRQAREQVGAGILGRLRRSGLLPAAPSADQQDLGALRDAVHDVATWHYARRMQPLRGGAVLVGAQDRSEYAGAQVDVAAGWDRAVSGGLTRFDIPGRHLEMLQPPHVAELAARLTPHLGD